MSKDGYINKNKISDSCRSATALIYAHPHGKMNGEARWFSATEQAMVKV